MRNATVKTHFDLNDWFESYAFFTFRLGLRGLLIAHLLIFKHTVDTLLYVSTVWSHSSASVGHERLRACRKEGNVFVDDRSDRTRAPEKGRCARAPRIN